MLMAWIWLLVIVVLILRGRARMAPLMMRASNAMFPYEFRHLQIAGIRNVQLGIRADDGDYDEEHVHSHHIDLARRFSAAMQNDIGLLNEHLSPVT
jgi:hypothetical protein